MTVRFAHSLYRPAWAREISRRTRTRRVNRMSSTSTMSTTTGNAEVDPLPLTNTTAGPSVIRPYVFHIGTSCAGKAEDPSQIPKVPFPADGLIGAWRDHMLAFAAGAQLKSRSLEWSGTTASGAIMSGTPLDYAHGNGHVPRNTRRRDAGEDFFFVQEMRNRSGVSFGVADGVGGWVDSGVDPSLFAQALMYHAHRYARSAWAGEPEVDPTLDYEEREQVEGWEMTPYECLDLAYGGVLREKFVQAGSSTACIISLNSSSGLLRSACLGDSGFSVIRSASVIHRQQAQTHFFNCPKQLTKLPANAGRKFSRACIDSPSEADTFQMKLRDGDIVVSYTDGFSDNVFSSEMATICALAARAGGPEDEQVQAMADRLVDYARQCMKSKKRVSPFEREAARQGMFFRGGKPDDVTVIVALVRETS